eukprot:COSAG01_NODE_143_length_24153_cov_54.226116_22_plen_108_part_00
MHAILKEVNAPAGSVLLDPAGGGHQRSFMARWHGLSAIDNDLRNDGDVGRVGRRQEQALQAAGCFQGPPIKWTSTCASKVASEPTVIESLGRIHLCIASLGFWKTER